MSYSLEQRIARLEKLETEHRTALKLLQYHLGIEKTPKLSVQLMQKLKMNNFEIVKLIDKYQPKKRKHK